ATLNSSGKVYMKITAERGRGYRSAEENKHDNQPIGVIPVDSIFTPVSSVSYQVEDTRIGQVANYDKFTMDVWTDGSIQPEEAVSLEAKVVMDDLSILVGLTVDVQTAEIMVGKEEQQKEKVLELTIEALDMSVCYDNC